MNSFVLPVDKQPGWTSHDEVQRLRHLLGIREIGHAGSLDPFATGLLLCGVGRGTKILPYLTNLSKVYVGTIRLGRVTDTGDRTGAIVQERTVGEIDIGRAQEVAHRFLGVQEQVPPMVSAIRHEGKRLYELARQGVEVQRKPRRVEIHAFEVSDSREDLIEFRVACSKGTYIRSLAQDFGEALGTGASVERLRRLAIGDFEVSAAVALDGESETVQERCREASISLRDALAHLPELKLEAGWVRKVRNGTQPPWRSIEVDRLPRGETFRLVGPEEELVAIVSLSVVPGPLDRPWRDSWELHLDRVL